MIGQPEEVTRKQLSCHLEHSSLFQVPEDCLGFGALVMGDAGDLYAVNRADGFDPHADIVAMPFSRF